MAFKLVVTDGVMGIERGPGRWPITMMVTALPETPVRRLAGDQMCLLFLFDPEYQVPPRSTVPMQEMGISAREAEIAVLLVMGDGSRTENRR